MYSLPSLAELLPPAPPGVDLGDGWKKTTSTNNYRSGAVTETKYFNSLDSSKIEAIKYSTSRAFNYGDSLTLTPKGSFNPQLVEVMTQNGFGENAKYGKSSLKIKDAFTDNRSAITAFMRSVQEFESLPMGVLEDLSCNLGIEIFPLSPQEIPSLSSLCEQRIISDHHLFSKAMTEDTLPPSEKENLAIKLSEQYSR